MNLLWIVLISSIPAGLSILLFLLRNSISFHQIENETLDEVSISHDSPTERNPPPLARVIQPQEKSYRIPVSPELERPLTEGQRNANRKAVEEFAECHYTKATEIVRKSLNKGDFRWRTLLDALEAEAQNYPSAGYSLTSEIYNKWLPKKDAKNIETASQCLVFGTWYTNIIKKPDEKVLLTLLDTWRLMGHTYM
ncbi:MAG: hypothetical protein ACRDF4_05370, partial [Rhabdochlamydiaceae bacterium]